MKRFVFIAICVLGLMSLSSCRSTSDPCGLADNTTTKQTKQLQQPAILVITTDIS